MKPTYELIASHVRDIVLVMRREDGRILEANLAATSAYGYSRDELLSLSIRDLRALETRPMTEEQMALAEAHGILFETVHRRKDGSTFPVEVSSRGATMGGTRSLISVVRDITVRKQAEEALRQSEEEFRAFFENAGVGAVQLDLAGRYTRVNNRYCEITGYSREELLAGKGPTDLSHPDDRDRDREYLRAVREGHAPPSIEKRVVRKDGQVVWAQVMSSVVRDASGQIVRTAEIFNDITEQKQAEERLRTSEVRLRAILEHAPLSMAISDLDGTIEYLNRKAQKTFGYSPADIPTIEQWFARAYPDESYRREVISTWTGLTQRALAEHQEIEGREYQVTCKDGSVKTTRIFGVPVADKVFVMFEDVTERKRAEEAMRRSEAVLAQAGQMASLGAWWIDYSNLDDLNANPLHWSPEVFRIFGYRPDEVPASIALFFERVHPEDRARVEQAVARALATRSPYSLEHRIVRRDGTERVVWEHGEGIFDDAGRPRRLIGAVQDITERKQAEEALREADRRKNEFLGVLSHELRNPLTPIRNSLSILERATPGGEQARRAHSVIDRQVSHLTRLVDDLLDVTRISSGKVRLQRTRLDLADALRSIVDDHRTLLEGHDVTVTVPDDPVWIDADPARLAQVVGNLLNNAAKFTPVDGKVSVSLTQAGDRAVLGVADTGLGLDPETLQKLFEPFAQADRSLDRSRGGLGLGLALVKCMVELHGGEVSAQSDGPGRGARFTVKLPLAAGGALAQPSLPPPDAVSPKRKVLVIEDNRDAADSLAEALELSGHQVAVAYDGRAGLAGAVGFRPQIVICDIGLPDGMDGYAVARALRRDSATAAAYLVALTGYAQPDDQRRALNAGFDAHLAKPVELAALERLLEYASAPGAASEAPG
ncbi:MAG: sensor hybrid histidine kinase [Myxococcaceae bacterium]|nr:sensor hybrid histidine kinase [Myxococcaceae bacterium]